jgi:hypothetical protein
MQREVAEAYMKQIEGAHLFDRPLATTLEPLTAFHPAEGYHHDYAARNPLQPYIRFVAQPKVEKMRAYQAHATRRRPGERLRSRPPSPAERARLEADLTPRRRRSCSVTARRRRSAACC